LGNYYAIVTCRNSENNIIAALNSLKDQKLKPEYVIVVNDGSTDRTTEILSDIQKNWNRLYVITHPDWGYDIKRVAKNWNEAIKLTKDNGLQKVDYHLIATDDSVYSNDYAEKIITYMDSNPNVAIVSGNYTKYKPMMPHGAGRFIRNSFFENTYWHGYYPEKMGYESAILYEANYRGYVYSVLNAARFEHTKPLGGTHKFIEFGASMQTLGYHPLFALARFLKYFITGSVTGRVGALYMLYYYLTYKPKPDGYDSMYSEKIRKYVRKKQVDRLKKIFFVFKYI
jgi:glycosyltransferase involved in cell wall biosynthesis